MHRGGMIGRGGFACKAKPAVPVGSEQGFAIFAAGLLARLLKLRQRLLACLVRRFVVKQYGEWREMFAVDKTAIRKTTYGRIEEIVELTKV